MRVNVGGSARVDTPWSRGQKQPLGHGYYGEHRVDDSLCLPVKSRGVYEEGGTYQGVNLPTRAQGWKLPKEQGRAAAAALEKIVVRNASLKYSENTDAFTVKGKELLGAMVGHFEGWRHRTRRNWVMETKEHGKERYRSALEKASYISGAGGTWAVNE